MCTHRYSHTVGWRLLSTRSLPFPEQDAKESQKLPSTPSTLPATPSPCDAKNQGRVRDTENCQEFGEGEAETEAGAGATGCLPACYLISFLPVFAGQEPFVWPGTDILWPPLRIAGISMRHWVRFTGELGHSLVRACRSHPWKLSPILSCQETHRGRGWQVPPGGSGDRTGGYHAERLHLITTGAGERGCLRELQPMTKTEQ